MPLEGPDGNVEENEEMINLAVRFYKNLFGYEPRKGVRLDDSFWKEDEKVSEDENKMLDAQLVFNS